MNSKSLVGILILAGTAVHGAPLATTNTMTFQQAAATRTFSSQVAISPTIQTIQPVRAIQVQPVPALQIRPQVIQTATFTMPTLTIKPQVLQVTPVVPKLQATPVLNTPKVGAILQQPLQKIGELTLDAASLASVALQAPKALADTLADPADAARLAVNNENVKPAAKVVTDGQMVVLMDEREERRKAVAAEIVPVKEAKVQPRVTATAASRRDSIAASIGKARRLATTTSSAKRLTNVPR